MRPSIPLSALIGTLLLLLLSASDAAQCESTDGSATTSVVCECGSPIPQDGAGPLTPECQIGDYCLAAATEVEGRCYYFPVCRMHNHANFKHCIQCDSSDNSKCGKCKDGAFMSADGDGICRPPVSVVRS